MLDESEEVQALIKPAKPGQRVLDDRALGVRHVGGGKTATHNQRFLGEKETDGVVNMIERGRQGRATHNKSENDDFTISEWHVRNVRHAGIDRPEDRESVLRKAAETSLTASETRAVADAYKQADTDTSYQQANRWQKIATIPADN